MTNLLYRRELYREIKKLVGKEITEKEMKETLRVINLTEKLLQREKIKPFIGTYFSQQWFNRNFSL